MSASHLQKPMKAQDYIQRKLEDLSQPANFQEVAPSELEDAIFAKIMSKKFRKLKTDQTAIDSARAAIKLAVHNNKPITISFLFGGYKLWRLNEAPEVEWAELFALMHFLNWLKPINSIYRPGTVLEFYSEDIALEELNNIPKSETDRYSETFISLIDWLKPYMPKETKIIYKRYQDEYNDYSEFLDDLEQAKILAKQTYGDPPKLSEKQKQATLLNVKLKPGLEKDPDWMGKVELVHKAMEMTPPIQRYVDNPSIIKACPTSYSGYIAVGSTKKSYAKFWAGVGALEKSQDGFTQLVLTPKQLANASFAWEKIHIDGLGSKNFSHIRILN